MNRKTELPPPAPAAARSESAALRKESGRIRRIRAELKHRDRLLDAGSRASFILFNTEEDSDIKPVLGEVMELLGQCVSVNQICVTQNETVDGILHFTCKYAWVSPDSGAVASIVPGMRFPYGRDPDWDRRFLRGICLNGPVRDMPAAIQDFFAPFAVKSALVVPVFVRERFWGLVVFSDEARERRFKDNEVTLLRSISLMMAIAVSRGEDLRERKKMLARIRQRDCLLQTVNQVADILLRSEPEDFSPTIRRCMGMMARAMRADRMTLWKNRRAGGKLYCARIHLWPEDDQALRAPGGIRDISYDEDTPAFKELYLRGESVNCLTREAPPVEKNFFGAYGILSVLAIPIFLEDAFWGFVSFVNCRSEELFSENEESVMRSGSLLIANALLRNEYLLSIRDTSARLEAALADAREANNAKSKFLAHMSHEIRTPLNAVIGFSELALGEDDLNREVEAGLEKIYSAGSTILSIVNDILDISKIESGKFEIYPVRYDTPSLINDTVALNIVRMGEKNISFSLHVDENLPGTLCGDDLRIKQIFNNLLANAFKFTESGAVEWRLWAEREGDTVWLLSSVRDTGPGIRPEDMPKLFSDYRQVDARANRKLEGTGLGLAISRRLAEMMGGGISAESEYGKGALFTVRLRQTAASDRTIGKEVAENLMGLRYTLSRRARNTRLAGLDLSYAHVLIVDDIETNLDVTRGMMKPYAMKIDCVTGGRQAVEAIRARNPRYSAVFMDHMMPGLDGIEATRIIREEIGTEYAEKIPIIALTANALVGNEEMFLSRGFQGFLSKPIDMVKLDAVLRRWVRDRELEKKRPDGDAALEARDNGNTPAGDSAPPDLAIRGMDARRALKRFSGNEAVFVDVLRSYAANVRTLLPGLRAYLEEGDAGAYTIAIHGIKGASYGICAQEAGKAAERLELAARAGDLASVKIGHDVFEKLAKMLLDDIDRTVSGIDAVTRRPVAAAPDPALLHEAREACRAFDMDRVDAAMARLESRRYERGGQIVAWLREKVDNMAFEDVFGGDWPS